MRKLGSNVLFRATQRVCQTVNAPSPLRLGIRPSVARSFHGLVVSSFKSKSLFHSIISPSHNSVLPSVSCRGYKNVFKGRPLKTKKAAWKRFKITGKGELKYQPAGKAHLNGTKSRTRLRRLNKKGLLKGAQAKNAKRLIILGR